MDIAIQIIVRVSAFIMFCFSFTFCSLASVVLLYYIRRRYLLSLEMKKITPELLWEQNYKNHLKNLKIKAMISNFIIIILLIEIHSIFSQIIFNLNSWLILFNAKWSISPLFYIINSWMSCFSIQCYVIVLCLFLKVLLLAYLNLPYKYTIMRWTAYILLRGIFSLILVQGWIFINQSAIGSAQWETKIPDIHIILSIRKSLNFAIESLFAVVDFITYIIYSRRFYQHLKSRELEARFIMDREDYIERRYVRIHFKIATILVAIAFFFHTLSVLNSNVCGIHFDISSINHAFFDSPVWISYLHFPNYICGVFFRFILSMDYLYITCIILYKYCRQKRKLTRINDRIRPLVAEYHEGIFSRYYR